MKVPVEWVNSLLSQELSVREMADAMELAGIEVEEVKEAEGFDPKILIGQIEEVRPHPNADKLRLARVDTGHKLLSIVCGASNIADGQLVPVAQVGSVLPDGTKIQKSKIRGEISEGMLCSESELGISNDHTGIMIVKNAKIGLKLDDIITTKSIIDVKTSANRWDLTSINGIAREVAAQTGGNVNIPRLELDFGPGNVSPKINSSLDKKLVNIYMLAPIRVDMAKTSPQWLKDRLASSGVRPINAVVDVTNYVLLEHGQPLHAFDASKVKGEVDVRLARGDEKLTTLDGAVRTLDLADIVIADTRKVLGLAGVMGGAGSEITDTTSSILLEAASFDPAKIRKTAIRHGLRSEASARFERGVPAYPHEAMAAAINLLIKYAGAELGGGIAVWHNLDLVSVHTTMISIDPKRINKLLGLELTGSEMADQLQKLSFKVDVSSATGSLTIIVPWWRPDIKHEADIAEEIIKLVGYDSLSSSLPVWRPDKVEFDQKWTRLWKAKTVLRSLDMFEVATYSFISKKQIEELGWDLNDFYELANPKSIEQAYLRENLLPSLLATAVRNRKYSNQFAMFEVSKGFVMNKEGELPLEQLTLGVLTVAPNGAYKWVKSALDRLGYEFNADLTVLPEVYDKVVGHPKRSGTVFMNGQPVGLIGQLHPDLIRRYKIPGEVGYLELKWDVLAAAAKPRGYKLRSQYPVIERDITAIVSRTVTWQQVRDALVGYKAAFVGDYYGKDLPDGHKSLTLRLTISRFDRTPTEVDAEKIVTEVVSGLSTKFKATVRN